MSAKRILIIDNRPEHLRQPVLRLQVEGFDVEEAHSEDEGLRRLREVRFDLLLLDAEMPEGDGWETLRRIREDPELAALKVIIFMAGQGETGKLGLVPVDGELRRPFSMGQLLAAVQKVLGG
ncbi:MAG TPA: response regulator [Actinomycetota bacterium]|nr:response regulator [Actinomycetota bacterium]